MHKWQNIVLILYYILFLFLWWVEVNDILSISICESIHKLRLWVALTSQLETDYFISLVLSVSLHLSVTLYLFLCFSLSFCLSLCLFVCLSLSLFLSFCLPVCLPVCLSVFSVYLSVCLSHPLYFTLCCACSSFFPCSFSSWLSHTYRHTCEHTPTCTSIHLPSAHSTSVEHSVGMLAVAVIVLVDGSATEADVEGLPKRRAEFAKGKD